MEQDRAKPIIRVVAGVLKKNNFVFMSSRPSDKVCGGSWEFPGGKLEDGEDVIVALIRELYEEIGVEVQMNHCSYLTSIEQDYRHACVKLDVFLINKWQGTPVAKEGQLLHWQDLDKPCNLKKLLVTTEQILSLIGIKDKDVK